MERFFDIAFSFSAFLVLFKQERVGRGGNIFYLFKFATMLKDSPNMGTGTITVKDDPRVLPLGKFLRKSKINELPQLFNIFRGDMSIIGPRPMTKEIFELYSEQTQNILKKVRPGLSGIGSIIFRREEEIFDDISTSKEFYRKIISPYKGSLEHWFVLNKGIKIYFLAISITILVVLFPKFRPVDMFFKNLPEPSDELKKILDKLD